MGTIRKPQEVKLFTGVIAVSREAAEKALREMQQKFGDIDVRSPEINFDFTEYYSPEMGRGLLRQWVSFDRLIDPSEIAAIKIATNQIEEKFSLLGKREVNLDPGYVTPAKVVLASSKDYSHRIYISGGIYAELTLMYRKNKFVSLEWTYPDYKSEVAVKFFNEIRKPKGA